MVKNLKSFDTNSFSSPAVTWGMMLVGATGYVRGALITVAQILGGISAAAVISALLPGPLAVRTSLSGGTSVVQGLFIEVSRNIDYNEATTNVF